jgi:hypothetical protein
VQGLPESSLRAGQKGRALGEIPIRAAIVEVGLWPGGQTESVKVPRVVSNGKNPGGRDST